MGIPIRRFRSDRLLDRGRRRRLVAGLLLATALLAAVLQPTGPATAAERRPYGPNAPWNVPVATLVTHARSAVLVDRLWNAGADHPGNFNLNLDDYTYPVHRVGPATRSFPVTITGWSSPLHGRRMPWSPAWRVAPGDDAQVIVLDPATGREWNLFQARFDGRRIVATHGTLVPGSYWTREVGHAPSRGSGIPYLAMLVRPHEIREGVIRHALSMPIRNPDGSRFVAPATKLERSTAQTAGVPQGTRFALRVTEAEIESWIAALPAELPATTRRSARIIARALRDYGWFVTDTSGTAHLQFESTASAAADWRRLGLGPREIEWRSYPRDLLDGLLRPERIRAIVPSDRYPPGLRARPVPPTG